jgi:hypothetical protein
MEELERLCMVAVMIVLSGAAATPQERHQAEKAPELDFLEYLGSWRGDDETWFIDAEIEPRHEDRPRREERRDEEQNE